MTAGNNFTDTATNTLTVQSQSEGGFDIFAYQTQLLTREGGSETILDFSGPTGWTGNCISNSECGWGYNSDDADVGMGSDYDGFTTTSPGDVVASRSTDTDLVNDVTTITYKTSVDNTQEVGTYLTTIVYILTPTF